eukprot:COSAG01_NODE_8086_length_2925_cov_12.218684_5_plen_68_part_00
MSKTKSNSVHRQVEVASSPEPSAIRARDLLSSAGETLFIKTWIQWWALSMAVLSLSTYFLHPADARH